MTPVRIGWTGHALRALSLAAGLACTAGFVVWRTQPELVHALDARIRRAYEEPWLDRWNAALALQATAPELALQQLDALGTDLASVRKLERGAVLVRMVSQHAMALAEGLGRVDSARWHARRLHEFDPRDLGALAQYCRLLAADADGRAAAIALLQPVVRRFPGHAPTAGLLAALLLTAGDPGAALAVLEAAAEDVQPAQWDVRWGTAAEETCWFLPVAHETSGLVASFAVDHAAPLTHLELRAPEGLRVLGLRVHLEALGQPIVATPGPGQGTYLVTLPQPLPPGRSSCTVRLDTTAAVPAWLRDVLLGDAGRALAAAVAGDAGARERLARLQERCR